MRNLFKKYKESIYYYSDTAVSHFYQILSPLVEKTQKAREDSKDETIKKYHKELYDLVVSYQDISIRSKNINIFAQKLGEIHFYCLCKERGISLTRVPESKHEKKPDFLFTDNGLDFYFEVKTPSIVGGEKSIDAEINDSLNCNAYLEDTAKNSKNGIAFATRLIKPYGNQNGNIKPTIDTLIDKFQQNYKQGQFKESNTFLVLNLSFIHNLITEPEELRPIYAMRKNHESVLSGIFWMLAFQRIGMAIFGLSEHKTGSIEGYVEKEGVLMEHSDISGIIIVTNPPKVEAELWGLFRNKTLSNNIETLIKFVDYRYNDEIDSRGACINEYNSDFIYNNKKT